MRHNNDSNDGSGIYYNDIVMVYIIMIAMIIYIVAMIVVMIM